MLVTVPAPLLAELAASPEAKGRLFGRRRDDETLLQVAAGAPTAGEELGFWLRAGAVPALRPGELALLIAPGEPPTVSALIGSAAGPSPVPCEIIGQRDELFARVQSLLPTTTLRAARVAVLGLGSGGSLVAAQLARSGVGAMHLLDKGRLKTQNVLRHLCGLSAVGRYKTRAVADALRDFAPELVVRTWEADLLAEPAALREALEGCTLVVAATDSEPAKLAINRACWAAGIPAVYGAAYNRAFGGDIFRAVPPDGACYQCLHSSLSDMFAPPPSATDDFSAGYADPSRMQDLVAAPGLALDIGMIALLHARVALAVLLRETSPNLAELPGNLLLFGNRAEWIFEQPLESVFVALPRLADCPVCNYAGYVRLRLQREPEAIDAEAARILAAISEQPAREVPDVNTSR